MSSPQTSPHTAHSSPAPDPLRWKALIFIGIAQLMVVLDGTVVNIALPHAQAALHIPDTNRQWVVTAYSLAFGGLLLFGGRISDLWGRKRAFVTGLAGFAGASALGGAAVNEAMLLVARAGQGVFGALLAPAALSLLSVTFTAPKERAKAFGIYGAIAGAGSAIGLLLGGLLTEYLDWRWVMFINIPFAAVAATGALTFVRERETARNRDRLDIPGVLLATGAVVSLVYGFTKAASAGWSAAITLAVFALAAVLLAAFVTVQAKVKSPLLPLRVIADRNRGGAYLTLGLAIVGMFGLFFFLTFYLQDIRGYSPVTTGFAFLPMVAGMITGSTQIAARLLPRIPARFLMGPGILLAAAGMLILTQLSTTSSYTTVTLPGMLLLGTGMGTMFTPAMSLATYGVQPRDAGVASAMITTSQQIGGSIGTALLSTIAVNATTGYLTSHHGDPALTAAQGLVHGYTTAIGWAAAIMTVASVVAFTLINARGDAFAPKTSTAAGQDAVPAAAH
ncbi:MFS transporter [Kitasatospora sp. NPDC096077]|uniref:MFS transporter n=1 Tax=Kitasatospora sp. NPDC096077 TaxID=3155544 RepID=UPI0033199724